ncbi:uncharacterized protein LOC123510446 [Portunus trituberculatus]|uniref:uncharacterized protein LOC123510446 n=1 Tax=Portunus trituberculatus TaxID=210409 RepID=UPI001E1CB6AC|nr:uncharacterized protein LOC123510446 [Portunus trituberculatus]
MAASRWAGDARTARHYRTRHLQASPCTPARPHTHDQMYQSSPTPVSGLSHRRRSSLRLEPRDRTAGRESQHFDIADPQEHTFLGLLYTLSHRERKNKEDRGGQEGRDWKEGPSGHRSRGERRLCMSSPPAHARYYQHPPLRLPQKHSDVSPQV